MMGELRPTSVIDIKQKRSCTVKVEEDTQTDYAITS